ncbi:MAG TPA: transporter [Chthoniobacterales bacterium]|nr:transporter [Chthoniobacterales bacterium]
MHGKILCAGLVVFFIFMSRSSAGVRDSISAVEQAGGRPAEAIQDNSFLIEEAYNQEAGVVQHIWNIVEFRTHQPGPDLDEWSFVFTQEWPVFSQTHQFSYTLLYSVADSVNGIGDIALNYRLQALFESETTPAFAPRFSLILPTGDEEEGLGNDVFGYQVNLPLSKIVSDRWTVHANAGATFFPDVDGHDLDSYNVGASAIYAVSRDFNLMLEALVNWDEEVDDFGGTERTVSAIISPGLRYAFNHPHDAQTVIGIAAPIGVSDDAPDFGVFLYASFEHFFYRPK